MIFGIVPYNWPYNLAAHKLAPAIASGNAIVLKPSPQAALSTLTLGRLIHEAGCPYGLVNIWNGSPKETERGISHPKVKMLSFTGSPSIGWMLKEKFPRKKVTLELGGDASAIVCEDADIEWAIPRLVAGGYGYAGQICISIQHVLVHKSIYSKVKERLIEATLACLTGDPRLEETVCGPMISSDSADRVESWIAEATQSGATVLAGGTRNGNVISPTLLENVSFETKVGSEEVFGPVLTISAFNDIDEAIKLVNRSPYGIHCGVFTSSPSVAQRAIEGLEVGGVVVNDYPTLRFDNLPYGGIKKSGFGREGVRYAMGEMAELKSVVWRDITL